MIEYKCKDFYDKMQSLFIGYKMEGKGGFINLMDIRSRYYSKFSTFIQDDIDNIIKLYPDFIDDVFDKLYSFFSMYFSKNGSICFNNSQSNILCKYDKDIMLVWRSQMSYYVKTDCIFRSMLVDIDRHKIFFDVSNIEYKKANEKRYLSYKFGGIKDDGTIVFNVLFTETEMLDGDIISELKKHNVIINDDIIKRAIKKFKRQKYYDFFINKNAKVFLQEQFNIWWAQYFYNHKEILDINRLNQLYIFKDIAYKIIDFISQFEDELVKIWNKPKFVYNSNYVITLDRINNLNLIKKIINHQNIDWQINEWQELGIVDDSFNINNIIENDLLGEHLNKKYEHLPIDTKYFKDLELEILNQFEDLDKALDGWLIKSENYQALNTILPKFKEKVQTIYIDPPFNLDSSDQFLYRTNYKDANWATLLENRLKLAKDWLNEKGSIFVRCDYNGNWIVRCLMDSEFGKENFRNEIAITRTKTALYIATPQKLTKNLGVSYDNIFWFSKLPETNYLKISDGVIWTKRESYWKDYKSFYDRPSNRYTLLGITPQPGCSWVWKKEEALKAVENYEEYLRISAQTGESLEEYWEKIRGKLKFLRKEGNTIKYWVEPIQKVSINDWTILEGYARSWGFPTENSEKLLKIIIDFTSNECDLILDFFLGSGTTTAVAHKLGRKWLGVEMGEHFYSVVLPRMKKVLAYDKSGISKEVKEYQGGGFFKYYELEQYEEALANCKYEDGDLFNSPSKTPYQEYVFMKDEKMLECMEIDYENNKVKVDLDKLYPNIDIAETLSNLTGKWIRKISNDEVEFEDGTIIKTKDLDYKLIKPLIWWE